MIKVYSTGPVENAIGVTTLSISSTIMVKLLNNNKCNNANVEVKVFKLDGTKTQTFSENIIINNNSSTFRVIDVSDLFQFEVQIKVKSEINDVLISVFGEDSNGELVAAQRFVHSELQVIKCLY